MYGDQPQRLVTFEDCYTVAEISRRRVSHPLGSGTERLSQQMSVPSVRMPQVWLFPTLTAAYVPTGGEAFLVWSHPQQAIAPSVRKPQVCQSPALTAVKNPSGGDACP